MSWWQEREVIDGHELYLSDCADACAAWISEGRRFDALVTDPPYGIGEAAGKNKSRGGGRRAAIARDYGNKNWDDRTREDELMLARSIIDGAQVVFGGNYYTLPPARGWLVWDKRTTGDFADCELAWTNLDQAVRRIIYTWNGMVRAGGEKRGDHPTQKPVGVMRWALSFLPPHAVTVMDPFMGSGTTGVAAAQMRRFRFVGVENDPDYFLSACRRMEEAAKEAARPPPMFQADSTPPPSQGHLLNEDTDAP